MMDIKRIVFPTDASESATQALQIAQVMAAQHDAKLLAVHVKAEAAGAEEGEISMLPSELIQDEVEAELTTAVPVEGWEVNADRVATGILHFAEEKGADLIAMGTHGRWGVRRLLIGSVAEEVVRLAPCPVVTVRKWLQQADEVKAINSILVPIDFSRHSRISLLHAAELAQVAGAQLHLLHIIEHRALPRVYDLGIASLSLERFKERSREALAHMVREELGIEDAHITAKIGYASDDIIDWAADHEIDLIVIGSHGRSGLERMLLGSVTERVVRLATCPVFTVKSFGKWLVDPSDLALDWPPDSPVDAPFTGE